MKNSVKEKLASGKAVFGTWMMTNSFDNAQILAGVGVDCIMIDAEHGSMDLESVGRLVVAIKTGPSIPMVRVAWNDVSMVKRALDTGCGGIMIPMVNSKKEAQEAVSYCKYPPVGVRGRGIGRATNFGNSMEYFNTADEEILTIIQIEHYLAVEAIDEILSVPGIDVAFIGPMDLSMSMNVPIDSPKITECFEKVVKACEKFGVAPGIFTTKEAMKSHFDMGFRCLLGGIDGQFLFNGAKAIADEFEKIV